LPLSSPKVGAGAWRQPYRVDTILEGVEKFETEGWHPPAKWTTSDRIAFILLFLFRNPDNAMSAQYINRHGRKIGDTTKDNAYYWWLMVLEKEGMVVRSPDSIRPIQWKITCNRFPLQAKAAR
jgi:hypothetical protein